jgi:hypothetical protein
MVHVLAAALGLSALLSASAELFAVIKLMGRSIWSIWRLMLVVGWLTGCARACPCGCLRSPTAGSSGKGC